MQQPPSLTPANQIPAPATVLIVEDEPALRSLAGDVAEAAGLAFIEANDAHEAMALLETRTDIGVVFTDIHLRGSMDGISLAEIVRRRWPWIDLLITSGKVIPHRHKLPEGSLYFAKPYDIEKVVEALRSFAERRPGHADRLDL
ncbi:MAG TPA: response regulator [Dongiaceae bacterium]|nr:response regulator [Dongiaceae bacterium]